MTILGRFGNTSGRPYVEGRLDLLRPGIHGMVSFLVDTGADRSVLMPGDGVWIGVDFATLSAPVIVGGVGGSTRMCPEAGVISLLDEDDNRIHAFAVNMLMVPPKHDLMHTASLLGRDVLDRCRVEYEKPAGRLAFTVRGCDDSVAIPPGAANPGNPSSRRRE